MGGLRSLRDLRQSRSPTVRLAQVPHIRLCLTSGMRAAKTMRCVSSNSFNAAHFPSSSEASLAGNDWIRSASP